MTNNLKTKFMLLGLFLSMIVFSGCGGVGVAVVDTDGAKNFYEYSLEKGDVYINGQMYTVKGGETIYIVGQTKDKDISMYKRKIDATSDSDIYLDIALYETADFTGGLLINNFNKNRNFLDNSSFEIYQEPTAVDLSGSTLLPFSNSLMGEKKISLESSEFADYIMKKNTIYILEIKNQNQQDVNVVSSWHWTE